MPSASAATQARHATVLLQQCSAPDDAPATTTTTTTTIISQPDTAEQQQPLLQPFSQQLPPHTTTAPAPVLPLPYVQTLLQQLDAVGWGKVTLAADLRQVLLQLRDGAGRRHRAAVTLPAGFPIAAPTVSSIQLPAPFRVRWLPGDSLATLVGQLEKALEAYQPLWQQLEDLDSHTQVLDPASVLAQPYSHCSRCIALGGGASCQLKLAPTAPTALPSSVVFHGPSSVVAALQTSWYSSAHKQWQEQLSVRDNLQAVLQIALPAPKPGVRKGCAAVLHAATRTASAAEGGLAAAELDSDTQLADADSDMGDDSDDDAEAGACAICYALHLPDPAKPDELGAAPGVTCPAAHCGRMFHAACLAEWLGALPSSRRVFDTLFGSCPFCQGPIGVSTRLPAAG